MNANDGAVLRHAFVDGVGSGARLPLLFAAGMVALAFIASLWLPQIRNGLPGPLEAAEAVGGIDGLELVEPERPIILFE